MMITKIWMTLTKSVDLALSVLFPVRLPHIAYYAKVKYDEQGSCGSARPKLYRDALDRIARTGGI
jgi:hypothetical protein